jgi:hypothetical protein
MIKETVKNYSGFEKLLAFSGCSAIYLANFCGSSWRSFF